MRNTPKRSNNRKYSYDIKVAACADYLLGKSYKDIEFKHGIYASTVRNWIRKRGCFKMRQRHARMLD